LGKGENKNIKQGGKKRQRTKTRVKLRPHRRRRMGGGKGAGIRSPLGSPIGP